MKTLLRRLVFLIILALIVPAIFPVSLPKAQAESVTQINPNIVPGQVIVKYRRPQVGSNSSFSAQSVSPIIQTLTFSEEISVSQKIAQLLQDPNVEYAEPVYKVHINGTTQSGTVTQGVYFNQSNLTYMYNWGATVSDLVYAADHTPSDDRTNIVVAVVDTGVDLSHPDLKDSLVNGQNFVNTFSPPQDDNGHGTNVAGIIAAKAHDLSGYNGVAPGTKIMPIKVLDQKGVGSTATLLAGIQYAIDNHADIINLSLGSYGDSKSLHDLIKQAIDHNILVIAAAGNDSDNWISDEPGQLDSDPLKDISRKAYPTSYPALYDEVISVGAVEQLYDTNLTVADFSNVLKVDVAAPGAYIYSTYLNGGYKFMHGTSQATSFVSGLAALIKANNPNISAIHLRAIIENSATQLPSTALSYGNLKPNSLITLKNFDFYGHGLINGQKPFQSESLEMIPDLSQLPVNTVSFTVYSRDIHGNIQVNNNSQVHLTSYLYEEDSLSRIDPSQITDGSDVNLVNGVGRTSLPEESLTRDAYHYKIFFQDPSHQQIASNSIDIIKKPAAPASSLNSGEFSGEQTITLTSATLNAEIYYTFDDGTTPVQLQKYSGPFTINKSGTITAYSLKNHVYSDSSVYNYSITPPAVGFFGGGGFIPPSAPQPTTDANGKVSLDLKPDHDALLKQINSSNSNEVLIDAVTETKLDTLSVELTGDIIQKANESDKSIVIKTNELKLSIPSNAFDIKDEKDTIVLKVVASNDPAPSLPQFAKTATPIYDFNLTVNGNPITEFHASLKAEFNVNSTNVEDPAKLGVYYLNEQIGVWTYVGGTWNGGGTITALLPHFSKYAVLDFRKTFEDIQNHWAKKEIEQLAQKQIVDGITDNLFKPDSNVTRAQFVTLISKALNLKNSGSTSNFQDVANDSWYKDAVYAAYQAKIVNGVADGVFAPEANITREQMATILVNAYLYATGKNLSQIVVTQEVKYQDEGTISTWARAQVRIASGLGLMNGVSNGFFAPGEDTSRAQATVVLYRLLNKLSE